MSIAELRKLARGNRRGLDSRYRHLAAARIQRQFLQSNPFFAARRIACYIAMPDEVDTGLIFERAWRAGKAIYAPVVDDPQRMRFIRVERNTLLRKSRFGIWEPVSGAEVPATDIDVVVAPVVAFDGMCNRIGMGGGHYDRTFSFLNRPRTWLRPKLVGLAFACQKVEKIAANPWDIRLYRVISDAT